MNKVTPKFTACKCGMHGALGGAVPDSLRSTLGSSKRLDGEMADAQLVTPTERDEQPRGGSGTARLLTEMSASNPVGNDCVDGYEIGVALAVPT